MKDFIIIGNRAVTGGKISLDDLPGSAGRMDVLCRCITSSLFVSWGMRRDVNVHLVLKGAPDPVKIVRFNGLKMRNLSPDERSSGSLIRKALLPEADTTERSTTPGVFVRKGTFAGLLSEMKEAGRPVIYLREDGEDIRKVIADAPETLKDAVYVLGDNQGVSEEDEKTLEEAGARRISLGPAPLLSSQCITIIQYETDRLDPPVNERAEKASPE
jgi:tRNA (pseudouridine54-N1)-methyltransferase